MAEHFKDAEDRFLESLFASAPVADDGFSAGVLRRIRRRLWIRRVAMVAALLAGGAVALKPALALTGFLVRLFQDVPGSLLGISTDAIPSTAMLAGGGLLFLLTVIGVRLLEE